MDPKYCKCGSSEDKKKRITMYCCVPQCTNYNSPGKSFHFFPKEESLKKKWEAALKMGKEVSASMRVCSDHFLPRDYFPGGTQRRKLFPHAIPSQNSPQRSTDKAETLPQTRWREARQRRASSRLQQNKTRFDCQPDRRKRTVASITRSVVIKRQRMELIKEPLDAAEKRDNTDIETDTANAIPLQHGNICCSVCGGPICGSRYSCVSCADYELCVGCEAAGIHSDHLMLRIANPLSSEHNTLVRHWCKRLSEDLTIATRSGTCVKKEEPFKREPLEEMPTEVEHQANTTVYTHKANSLQEPPNLDFDAAACASAEASVEASAEDSDVFSNRLKKGTNAEYTWTRQAESATTPVIPATRLRKTDVSEKVVLIYETEDIDIVKTELEEAPDIELLALRDQTLTEQAIKMEEADPLL